MFRGPHAGARGGGRRGIAAWLLPQMIPLAIGLAIGLAAGVRLGGNGSGGMIQRRDAHLDKQFGAVGGVGSAPEHGNKRVLQEDATAAPQAAAVPQAASAPQAATPAATPAAAAAAAAAAPEAAATQAGGVDSGSRPEESSGQGGGGGQQPEQSSMPPPERRAAVQERDFRALGFKHHTDKVEGNLNLALCLKTGTPCVCPTCQRDECKPWGHFYDTLYRSRLGALSRDDAEPFQLLEIGFYQGGGYNTFREFMPRAEAHSIELLRVDASKHPQYKELRASNRLHIGSGSNITFLHETWTNHMRRPGAPPLRVVIDDGSHMSMHMAASVFFWFPRLEPGGLLVVEDIQPITSANEFRTQFLPQIMADLHFCGTQEVPDSPCFPTLMPLLQSVHCEMHICVFERNQRPAVELSLKDSSIPLNALKASACKSFQRQ